MKNESCRDHAIMKYVALFRGINVGGHHLLPMRNLKDLLLGLQCNNVESYIQSGNVIFECKEQPREELRRKIEERIDAQFHFRPKVLLLDEKAFRNAVTKNPFPVNQGKALHFFFLDTQPFHPDSEKLAVLKAQSEEFKLHKELFYLYAPDGIGRSKLASNVEKCLGVSATARNWNTVQKLIDMLDRGRF